MGIDDAKFAGVEDQYDAFDPALLADLEDVTADAVASFTPSPLGADAKRAMYAGIRFTGYQGVMQHVVIDPLQNTDHNYLEHGTDVGHHVTYNPAIFPGALEPTGTPTAVDFEVGPAFEVVSEPDTPVELPVVIKKISDRIFQDYVKAAIIDADTDPENMDVKFDDATASPPPGVPTRHEADLKTVVDTAAKESRHPTAPVEAKPKPKPRFPFRFKK